MATADRTDGGLEASIALGASNRAAHSVSVRKNNVDRSVETDEAFPEYLGTWVGVGICVGNCVGVRACIGVRIDIGVVRCEVVRVR